MCLAVALSKYPDIDITVYEAASSLREAGAGVMLWGRTWRVITLLGLIKLSETSQGYQRMGRKIRAVSPGAFELKIIFQVRPYV